MSITMTENFQYLVSVILPVYNAESTVARAIKSILNQTYKNLEIIIINDGSTDTSLEIIESVVKGDERVKIISRENKGLIETLNEGIRISHGKLIAREDADDYSDLDRIRQQVAYMSKFPEVVLLGTNNKHFGKINTKKIFPEFHSEAKAWLLFSPPVAHPSVMLRKSFLINHKLFYNADYIHCEDYALWLDIVKKGGEISNIQRVLHHYHVSDNQISVVMSSDTINGHYRIVKEQLTSLGLDLNDEDLKLFAGVDKKFIYGKLDLTVFSRIIKLYEQVNEINQVNKKYDEYFLKKCTSTRLCNYLINYLGTAGYEILKSSKCFLPEQDDYKFRFSIYKRDLKNIVKGVHIS